MANPKACPSTSSNAAILPFCFIGSRHNGQGFVVAWVGSFGVWSVMVKH
ncbi:MAG: hypothetical protein IPJ38_15365 [Dechloromonas sp.]|uniref:Uncharacterized protein n=1 Tax=Candidatus Dechloromonas phosphorivorans TaxID=2899244 RepID=A0A935JYD4_9RHOO|nr:hypothetical protein [Candidatus Dechloromonas phosphorivorans]